MATYSVENAKSGRSKCKKCKETIEKNTLRVGVHTDGAEYQMSSWHHPACFNIPRKLGMTAEEFVQDTLRDDSEGGTILPAQADELVAAFKSKGTAAKNDDDGDAFILELAKKYAEINDSPADENKSGGKKKRKAKDDDNDDGDGDDDKNKKDKKKRAKKGSDEDDRALELYGKYHKETATALKAILRWNRQTQTGTKPILLHKVIDGATNGRLARCQICGGRLKLHETGTKVVCDGTFDEDAHMKITCSVSYEFEKAPRWQPWYSSEPTEEETEEMKRLEEEAQGEGVPDGDGEVDENSDLGKLLKTAEDLEINLDSQASIKKSTAAVVSLLKKDGSLDIPDDAQNLRMAVGKVLINNKKASTAEIFKLLAKQFGFSNVKAEKEKTKTAAVGTSCAVPENGPLVSMLDEMASLYFKEGNKNGGMAYKKVVAALKDLDFPVTKENALSLGKAGKNKVQNIGASSAKKMLEFLETGKIEKLEELRQNAA